MSAQMRGFDLLIRSVDIADYQADYRTLALACKSDGLILHDRLLDDDPLVRLAGQIPIVTLAGVATPATVNVRSDNASGMGELARHLLRDHGYRSIGYVSGYADSPDSRARHDTLAAEAAATGASFASGPDWQGNYYAAGGAQVIDLVEALRASLGKGGLKGKAAPAKAAEPAPAVAEAPAPAKERKGVKRAAKVEDAPAAPARTRARK